MIQFDKIDAKFTFVLAASKRARQLQAGAKPLVETHARKATRIAMEEVAAGVVPFDLPPLKETEEDGKGKKGKSKKSK